MAGHQAPHRPPASHSMQQQFTRSISDHALIHLRYRQTDTEAISPVSRAMKEKLTAALADRRADGRATATLHMLSDLGMRRLADIKSELGKPNIGSGAMQRCSLTATWPSSELKWLSD